MIKIIQRAVIILIPALILISCGRTNDGSMKPDIKVGFTGDAQIETGGPYEGAEFHHSSPMPQRISFFYPAANSIDLSTDYWRRDTTRVMYAGLRIGYGKKQWIGLNPYSINYTPYGVTFYKKDKQKSISIAYRFCESKPAMVIIYKITNNGSEKLPFEFYTHLELSLRTSHTYALVKKAWTEYDPAESAIYANFNNEEVHNCSIFAANAGLTPDSYTTNGNLSTKPFADDWWIRNYASLPGLTMSPNNPGIPAASFLYKEDLAPGKTMEVVQIIGSSKQDERKKIVKYLTAHYKKEIDDYENDVLKYAEKGMFSTGDTTIDKSFKWAKAILAVNKHYIDGSIVPMPCPAEYNYYFTHDVLVTDYAAVNFDIDRVKNDLNFIITHSKNLIIPHAYYWKDSAYVTEYASSDNWNNFWFIITAGSYLKHSGDTAFAETLYPYVSKCLERTLTNMKSDSLMWEAHIDGSDLGDSYGPRAFMTSLAVKSLKEYLFISSVLHKDDEACVKYERIEKAMASALNKKLWSS